MEYSFQIEQLLKKSYFLSYSKEESVGTLEQVFLDRPEKYKNYHMIFILTVNRNGETIWVDKNEVGIYGSQGTWTKTSFDVSSEVSYSILLNDILVESGIKEKNADSFDITFHDCEEQKLFGDANKVVESETLQTQIVPVDTQLVHDDAKTKDWELIVDTIERNGISMELYSWPLMTKEFCQDIIEEAEKYGEWTNGRHANYPTHDILIDNFGYGERYNNILREYACPIVKNIWNLSGEKWDNMSAENFIVKYDDLSEGWQNNLGVHHDMSDYTFVLGLNEGYEGGGTWFPRQKVLLDRPIGWITVHPTITHRHGARSVTNGVRYVLISFCRNGNEGN